MKQILIHPDADAEITEASQFYEARNSGLGWDFLGELKRAFDQIASNPEASPRVGKRVRRKMLWRFPYNLIFISISLKNRTNEILGGQIGGQLLACTALYLYVSMCRSDNR